MTEEEILEDALFATKELEAKYCDLVWYARSKPEHEHIKGVLETRERIERMYPDEVKQLITDDSNWSHGFNSGMLAGMRYAMEAMEYGVLSADESFPFLDT